MGLRFFDEGKAQAFEKVPGRIDLAHMQPDRLPLPLSVGDYIADNGGADPFALMVGIDIAGDQEDIPFPSSTESRPISPPSRQTILTSSGT